jgi:TolA-binding protein
MRHARWALVAAAVVSVAGWAAAARWSGVRWATSSKLPTSDAPGRSSNATGLSPVGRGKPPVVSYPSSTPSTNEAPSVVPSLAVPTLPTVTVAAVVPDRRASAVHAVSPHLAAPLELASRAAVASSPPRVAASPPEPAVQAVLPPDAPALFGRANEARRRGDHASAAHYYRALIEDYPASSEAHDALAVLGRMLLDDTDAEGALRCFDEYLRVGGPLREDVMLGRALSLRRLGRAGDETRALEALVAAYPRSVHAERARRRLLDLGRP